MFDPENVICPDEAWGKLVETTFAFEPEPEVKEQLRMFFYVGYGTCLTSLSEIGENGTEEQGLEAMRRMKDQINVFYQGIFSDNRNRVGAAGECQDGQGETDVRDPINRD